MIGIKFNSNRYVPRNTIFTITDIRPVNILSMPSEDNRIFMRNIVEFKSFI